jgi:hypothetical protein
MDDDRSSRSDGPLSALRLSPQDLSTRQRRLLAVCIVAIVVLLMGRGVLERGDPTGEAVQWTDYPAELQVTIERHVAAADCDGLRTELRSANATNQATLVRTGHDNARLIAYLGDQLRALRC